MSRGLKPRHHKGSDSLLFKGTILPKNVMLDSMTASFSIHFHFGGKQMELK